MAQNRKAAALITKQKLLDASKKIIREKGLTNVAIEEITEAAGVSKGTFYTYFKRKEDVVYALSSEMIEELFDYAFNNGKDVFAKLKLYLTAYAEYAEHNSLKLAQEWIKNIVCAEKDVDSDGKCKFRLHFENIKNILIYGIETGELKKDMPVEKAALAFMDVLWGELLCWCVNAGSYSLKKHTEDFCNSYLNAMLKNYTV